MFAQIPQQAFFDPKLKGLRFEIFAAVIMEMYEGGGVCRLAPKAMADKYPHFHYDNFCRVRKEMIADGYLIEVVDGIVTKDLNTTAKNAVEAQVDTAKIAVNEPNQLRKTQSTAENAVQTAESTAKNAVEQPDELRKTQSATAKNAGTPIALNKNLEFKEIDLNGGSSAHAYAHEVEILPEDGEPQVETETIDEEEKLLNASPFVQTYQRYFIHQLKKAQKQIIVDRIRDGTLWLEAVQYWAGNDHKAESIGRLCKKYDELVEENGGIENATIQPTNTKRFVKPCGGVQPKQSNRDILANRDYTKYQGLDPSKEFG